MIGVPVIYVCNKKYISLHKPDFSEMRSGGNFDILQQSSTDLIYHKPSNRSFLVHWHVVYGKNDTGTAQT